MITGLNPIWYLISNFIVDFVKFLVPIICAIIMIKIYSVEVLNRSGNFTMILLILFISSISILLFIYAISFLFNKASSAQICVFVVSYLTSIVMMVSCFSFLFFDRTWNFS